jgi:hypothetical protein
VESSLLSFTKANSVLRRAVMSRRHR